MWGGAFGANLRFSPARLSALVQTEMQRALLRMTGVVVVGIGLAFGAAAFEGDARVGRVLIGGPKNERISGGPGVDMAVFSGSRWSYLIFRIDDHQVVIVGPNGETRLTSVEVLHFDDMTVDLGAALSRTLTKGLLESIPVWRVSP